jgi:hypothetical protein
MRSVKAPQENEQDRSDIGSHTREGAAANPNQRSVDNGPRRPRVVVAHEYVE